MAPSLRDQYRAEGNRTLAATMYPSLLDRHDQHHDAPFWNLYDGPAAWSHSQPPVCEGGTKLLSTVPQASVNSLLSTVPSSTWPAQQAFEPKFMDEPDSFGLSADSGERVCPDEPVYLVRSDHALKLTSAVMQSLKIDPPPGLGADAEDGACSSGVSTADTNESTHLQLSTVDRLCADDVPTVGSALHGLGVCRPCAFVFKGGCESGVNCKFCHLCEPDEKKRRKKDRNDRRVAPARMRRATPFFGA